MTKSPDPNEMPKEISAAQILRDMPDIVGTGLTYTPLMKWYTVYYKYIRAALKRSDLAPTSQWRDLPKGWHVSWMGEDDGAFLCQIKRHDDDLDYLGDISFVSTKSLKSLRESYNEAVDIILKEYAPPTKDLAAAGKENV